MDQSKISIMEKINCPKCDREVEIDISNAADENAESYMCPHCHFIFGFYNN